jgi:hypothetical protein
MNIRNKEGYMDRTPFEAMKAIEKQARPHFDYHPMVYICSPYAGNIEENVFHARRYSRFAVEKGYLPITPHLLYPQFLDDTLQSERDLGIFFGIVLMSKCSEVWVFGEKISNGMKIEVGRAKSKGYKLRYFNCECTPLEDNTIQ